MATVDIPEEIDKLLSELSKKTGKTKADILRELLESITSDNEVDEVDKLINFFNKEVAGEGEISKMMKDIAVAKMYMKVLDGGDNWAKALQPILMMNLIKQMTRPDPYELLLLEKLSKGKDDDLKRLLEEYRKSEEEKFKMLQDLLLKSKSEEEKKELVKKLEELNKRIEDKEREKEREEMLSMLDEFSSKVSEALRTVNERISYLEQNLMHAQNRNDIISQIQQLKQLRENLKEIADVLGFVEKRKEVPITTKEGKMDWGKAVYELIRDGMDKVAEIVKVMKQSPPPMQVPQEYYPQNFNQENFSQEQLEQYQQLQEEVKKTEEAIKEVQERVEQVIKEEKQEEIKEEPKEIKQEEIKIEQKEEQSNNQSVVTDDDIKVPGLHFATLGDLKRKLGRDDLYIREDGTVCYKVNGIERQLSKEQLEELENEIFKEKLERGEIKYNVDYDNTEDLFKDENTLKTAYMFAKEGMRITLKDGTDITDKVIEEGQKRGYPTLEELAKQYGGGKETEEAS